MPTSKGCVACLCKLFLSSTYVASCIRLKMRSSSGIESSVAKKTHSSSSRGRTSTCSVTYLRRSSTCFTRSVSPVLITSNFKQQRRPSSKLYSQIQHHAICGRFAVRRSCKDYRGNPLPSNTITSVELDVCSVTIKCTSSRILIVEPNIPFLNFTS